ncbi:MAG: hypothetical protein ABIJ91_04690 [Candidatus Kuenenbacteria bacterium]
MSITVINGVNELTASLAGKSVGEIRGMLSQALNISPDAIPQVDGDQVGEDFVLGDSDTLEFVKPSGTKG